MKDNVQMNNLKQYVTPLSKNFKFSLLCTDLKMINYLLPSKIVFPTLSFMEMQGSTSSSQKLYR
jgi:hypothetical protein